MADSSNDNAPSRGLSTQAIGAIIGSISALLLILLVAMGFLLVRAVKRHRQLMADMEERGIAANSVVAQHEKDANGLSPTKVLRKKILAPYRRGGEWDSLKSRDTVESAKRRGRGRGKEQGKRSGILVTRDADDNDGGKDAYMRDIIINPNAESTIAVLEALEAFEEENSDSDPNTTTKNSEKPSKSRPWKPTKRNNRKAKKAQEAGPIRLRMKRIGDNRLSAIVESPVGKQYASPGGSASARTKNPGWGRDSPEFIKGDTPAHSGMTPKSSNLLPVSSQIIRATPGTPTIKKRTTANALQLTHHESTSGTPTRSRPSSHIRRISTGDADAGTVPSSPVPPLPTREEILKGRYAKDEGVKRKVSLQSCTSVEIVGSELLSGGEGVKAVHTAHMRDGPSRELRESSIRSASSGGSEGGSKQDVAESEGSVDRKSIHSSVAQVESDGLVFDNITERTAARRHSVQKSGKKGAQIFKRMTPQQQRVSRVTATGSPKGRKSVGSERDVLGDVSGNPVTPTRRHSSRSRHTTSSRSSDGNPFQWETSPIKDDATTGSPSKSKEHKRQNCVKILVETSLKGPPSATGTPSKIHRIREEESPELAAGANVEVAVEKSKPTRLAPPTASTFSPRLASRPQSLRMSSTETLVPLGNRSSVYSSDMSRLSTMSTISFSAFPQPASNSYPVQPSRADSETLPNAKGQSQMPTRPSIDLLPPECTPPVFPEKSKARYSALFGLPSIAITHNDLLLSYLNSPPTTTSRTTQPPFFTTPSPFTTASTQPPPHTLDSPQTSPFTSFPFPESTPSPSGIPIDPRLLSPAPPPTPRPAHATLPMSVRAPGTALTTTDLTPSRPRSSPKPTPAGPRAQPGASVISSVNALRRLDSDATETSGRKASGERKWRNLGREARIGTEEVEWEDESEVSGYVPGVDGFWIAVDGEGRGGRVGKGGEEDGDGDGDDARSITPSEVAEAERALLEGSPGFAKHPTHLRSSPSSDKENTPSHQHPDGALWTLQKPTTTTITTSPSATTTKTSMYPFPPSATSIHDPLSRISEEYRPRPEADIYIPPIIQYHQHQGYQGQGYLGQGYQGYQGYQYGNPQPSACVSMSWSTPSPEPQPQTYGWPSSTPHSANAHEHSKRTASLWSSHSGPNEWDLRTPEKSSPAANEMMSPGRGEMRVSVTPKDPRVLARARRGKRGSVAVLRDETGDMYDGQGFFVG